MELIPIFKDVYCRDGGGVKTMTLGEGFTIPGPIEDQVIVSDEKHGGGIVDLYLYKRKKERMEKNDFFIVELRHHTPWYTLKEEYIDIDESIYFWFHLNYLLWSTTHCFFEFESKDKSTLKLYENPFLFEFTDRIGEPQKGVHFIDKSKN